MFKKIPLSLAALTVLQVEKATSVQLQQAQQKWNSDLADKTNVQLGAAHRHHHKKHHHQSSQSIPACNSIECKTETAAPNKLQKDQDPWKKDYFVPNFGVDHDIVDSQGNAANAAATCKDSKWCGQPWVVAAQAEKASIPACNSIECKTETAATAKLQKDTDPWEKDYFVPNFGVDHDIIATHTNAAAAKAYCAGKDARCGQPWQVAAQKASVPACNSIECKTETAAAAKLQKDTDPWDKDYFVPNFGVDHDILDTHHNAANAEASCKGGKCGQQWVVAAQKDKVSIPACNSIECKTKSAADAGDPKHPQDYFVPNFGLDHDIIDTHQHDKAAQAYCGADGSRCGQPWYVAAQRDSIPACNSVECKTVTAETEQSIEQRRDFDQKNLKDSGSKAQVDSIPFCTSFECKTESSAPAEFRYTHAQKDSVPACTSLGCKTDTAAKEPSLAQSNSDTDSRPACTSFECKTGTAAPKVATPLWAVHYEPEKGVDEVQLGADSIPACNSIECLTKSAADAGDPKHPMDYFVPNFGLDHDILDTWKHEKYAKGYCKDGSGWCGQPWVVAAQQENVQLENESIPACNSIECKTETAAPTKLQKDQDPWKKDYFIPNFGVDKDILDSQSNHVNAAASCKGSSWCGQPWVVAAQQESIPACNSIECKTETAAPNKLQKDQDPWKKDYFIPNFGVDKDILDSQANHVNAAASCKNSKWCGQQWQVAAQTDSVSDSDSRPACTSFECKTGTAAPKVATPLWAVHYEPEKGVNEVQLGEESIPACNSIECKTETAAPTKLQKDQDPWKKDYFIPNFGVDKDILDSQANHVGAAASCKGSKWCGQPWVVAAQVESIPACNSIECLDKTAAKAGGPPEHPTDYKVPDFGMDHDIVASIDNLKNTQEECLTKGLAFGKCQKPWTLSNVQLHDVYENTPDVDVFDNLRIKVNNHVANEWTPNRDEIENLRQMNEITNHNVDE